MPKGFEKFVNVKPSGAKKKESLKQEKRAIKKEREAFFINKKREERAAKKAALEQQALLQKVREEQQPSKKFTKKEIVTKEVTAFNKDGQPLQRKRLKVDKTETSKAGRKSYFKSKEELFAEKNKTVTDSKAVANSNFAIAKNIASNAKMSPKNSTSSRTERPEKAVRIKKDYSQPALNDRVLLKNEKEYQQLPLNKYVAHCGVCSRREAASLVKLGKIQVNNKLIMEPGYKVQENDIVKFEGKTIKPQTNLVYILLNKPKDFLTTADDPGGRKTVMDLVANATNERLYPVGRLDRNTTGVLLLTNDGDLAQKLTHPKNEIKKIYEVKLDRDLTKADAEKILAGIKLEDGFIAPDTLAYADTSDKSVIGIEIHSGKNRIVRRIFEYMGYEVKALDRVLFAGLTKKNVERGRYRFLLEREVRNLKFLNATKGKKVESNKKNLIGKAMKLFSYYANQYI